MWRLRWQTLGLTAVSVGLALETLGFLVGWLRQQRRRRHRSPRREVLFFPSQVTCTEALLQAQRQGGPPGAGAAAAPAVSGPEVRRSPGAAAGAAGSGAATATTAPAAAAAAGAAAASSCLCPLPHGESSLSRLLQYVLSARSSLELCLFAFSNPQLGRAVHLLHQQGVRIRVVTDCDYMALNGSQIGRLRKAGIQVRHDQGAGYMHHKFAIVDKKMLITGSLNWTTQAIQNNRENVLIVEDEEYVRLFLEEFERIWEEFNPVNYTFFPQRK
ncbi:mitochondrial cardiolipin hydrolase [Trichosurus vulpecula]|uniref:mitochondrial cardiolipin hydrolase n=1 Tax=Trichosurus vulpecula TaxID=9337 RepID=UPI00186ADF33|nr:mitochondrial cardiolipin hydrolase [Trichosurus vulpecula]